jgi:hypothetical protein
MKSVVRPELSTAAAGPSQAPTAAVDNSAPRSTHPEPTYKSGKTVQLTGTTSVGHLPPLQKLAVGQSGFAAFVSVSRPIGNAEDGARDRGWDRGAVVAGGIAPSAERSKYR